MTSSKQLLTRYKKHSLCPHFMKYIVLFLFSFVFIPQVLLAEDRVYISSDENGFYNYDRQNGEVIFTETRFWRTSNNSSQSSTVSYRVDLSEKKVISSYSFGGNMQSCIGLYAKRSYSGAFIVSYDPENNLKKLYGVDENDCRTLSGTEFIGVFAWAPGGDKLVIIDRDKRVFRTLEPNTLNIREYSDDNNSPRMLLWSNEVKANLFVFYPEELSKIEPYKRTSNDYRFFYLDESGTWERYHNDMPLKTPNLDVSFRISSDIEVAPWTEFVNIESNEIVSSPEYFFLGHDRWNIVWLNDGWVYFQGAAGVFNYRSGNFERFGGSAEDPVVPFAVGEERYAIMYHQQEDRLKVYDLKNMKYIESYEPFWREVK